MMSELTVTAPWTGTQETSPSCGNGRSFTAAEMSGQFMDERSSSSWIKRVKGSSGLAWALDGPGPLPWPKSSSSCWSGSHCKSVVTVWVVIILRGVILRYCKWQTSWMSTPQLMFFMCPDVSHDIVIIYMISYTISVYDIIASTVLGTPEMYQIR